MQKILFTQNWEFVRLSTGEKQTVHLPHDATIGEDRDPNIRIGYLCAYFHGGKYEYVKRFVNEWENKTVYIEFEGIYRNFEIFINGNKIASQANGYVGVCKRIDEFLRAGENEIKVTIDTPYTDHTRWYAGSGIYRDVFLYVGEDSHIPPNGVKVTTLGYAPAAIRIQTAVCGAGEICVSVLDGETAVASGKGDDVTLKIPNAKLWNERTPYLYTVKVSLCEQNGIFDETSVKFGIRTLSWNAEEGFLVNGERTLLRGGCIHADNGILGMVTTRQTEFRRIRKIKEAGFNAIRSAHHLASPALIEACDELGMFVMDEAFDSWYRMKTLHDFSSAFYSEYKSVIAAMAQKDYNHPSVVMYSIGNEIPEIGSKKAIRFGKEMIAILKNEDATRPVLLCPSMRLAKDFMFGMPYDTVEEDEFLSTEENRKKDFEHYVKVWTRGLKNELSVFAYTEERKAQDERATSELYNKLDIAGYNYYGEYYEDLHAIHPERVILGTETEGNKLSYHYAKMKSLPYVIGDFVWTLQDHLGECNCAEYRYGEATADKSYPWINNWCGKLDLTGNENITAHRYRMVWGLEKGIVLAAQPPVHNGIAAKFGGDRETDAVMSWTFEGTEGNKTYIDVVSDAPTVEVFINGKSLGKVHTEDYAARFFTEYVPGTAEAVGYDEQGKELYRNSLQTAEKDTRICAELSADTIEANGSDMCFIDISVCDENGIIKSLPERKIKVTVSGAAYLAAIGSGAYKTEEKYTSNVFTTFDGKCLAVIRSFDFGGKARVCIESEGIDTVVKEIEVTK